MKELDFIGKSFVELDLEQKKAMVERACMDAHSYLKEVSKGTAGTEFLRYWMDNASNLDFASMSVYMGNYLYDKSKGLCVRDNWNDILSIKYNIKEVLSFVHNSINAIPFKTPIIDLVILNHSLTTLSSQGIDPKEYGNVLPNTKKIGEINSKSRGRKVDEESKLHKIRTGKMTRYEAYYKNNKDSF